MPWTHNERPREAVCLFSDGSSSAAGMSAVSLFCPGLLDLPLLPLFPFYFKTHTRPFSPSFFPRLSLSRLSQPSALRSSPFLRAPPPRLPITKKKGTPPFQRNFELSRRTVTRNVKRVTNVRAKVGSRSTTRKRRSQDSFSKV